jgi:hypothetical protein
MDELTCRLKMEAERIASRHPLPEFYARFNAPMALARKLYYNDPLIGRLRKAVQPILQEEMGHGIYHSMRVSIDSATLIFVEMAPCSITESQMKKLMMLGLIAGLLHDICRSEEKHAEVGAIRAAEVLKDFPLTRLEVQCICRAIKNHEAFISPTPCKRPWSQLISDCLYDADKFRWGPDTFTHTLWHMADHQGLTPRDLIERFPWGMTGVFRIRDTFRTSTGKQYGPEIIETGVEIGREIYRYLLQHYREQPGEQ